MTDGQGCEYITLETAPELIGKTVDCLKRRFHYYPLKIAKNRDGRYCVVDRNNVWMPINENDKIPFDFVVGREYNSESKQEDKQ